MLTIQMLGRAIFQLDGERVTGFISDKALALFCYLIRNQGDHARETLAGLLWGEMSGKRAKANLRQALHNLRTLFPTYLRVSRKTAAFDHTQPYELDVEQFVAGLGEEANQEAAVALYQGEFLQGLYIDSTAEFEVWLREEREHLRLALLNALESLVERAAADRCWSAVVTWSRQALTVEPWREAMHRHLMMALARQGKYTAALQQYEQCREILAAELNVEPMSDTTVLYDRIARLRRLPPVSLPTPSTPLIGREAQLQLLNEWLTADGNRLLTILGLGGVGKTRLALAAAEQASQTFLEGVCFVPLAAVESAAVLPTTLADALNVALTKETPPLKQLLAFLADKELLLVLDNYEQLLPHVETIVAILTEAPQVQLLVTSRAPLNLRRERLFDLAGLSYPPPGSTVAAAESYSAGQLFLHTAQRVQRRFTVTAETAAAIQQICQLVVGVPLALELAATAVRQRPCREIAAALQHSVDVLTTTMHDVPERQRSFRAVFEYSWSLLTEAEQALFMRLAVFRGGFTFEAAAAVAEGTRPLLATLVDCSFLRLEENNGRYEIHELLRQYALQALQATNETTEAYAAVRTAHAHHYLRFVQQEAADFTAQTMHEKAAVIGQEIDNIRAGWHWAVTRRSWPLLAWGVIGLNKFYEARGWYQEGEALFGAAVETLRPEAQTLTGADQLAWGRLLSHYTALLLRLGRAAQAAELATESVTILRQHDEPAALGFALNTLGIAQMYQGAFAEAETSLLACAEVYRQMGNEADLVKPLANLGSLYLRQGAYEAGKEVLQEGLQACRVLNDQRGLGHFLTNLGAIYVELGELTEARQMFVESLAVSEEVNNLHVKAVTLSNLGEIAYKEACWAEAAALFAESTAVCRLINDERNLARGLSWLALALSQQGELSTARSHLREALELVQAGQGEPLALEVLYGVAHWLHGRGESAKAAVIAQQILTHPALQTATKRDTAALLAQLETDVQTEELSLEERIAELLRHI